MKQDNIRDKRLDSWVGLGLMLGIAVSLALVVIGIVMVILTGATEIVSPVSLDQIPGAIVITVGIFILLLTPVIQVIAAIVLFSVAKNRPFVVISAVVLCFAAISLALALI